MFIYGDCIWTLFFVLPGYTDYNILDYINYIDIQFKSINEKI